MASHLLQELLNSYGPIAEQLVINPGDMRPKTMTPMSNNSPINGGTPAADTTPFNPPPSFMDKMSGAVSDMGGSISDGASSMWDSTMGDDAWRLRKAIALNSMRLEPDAALTASLTKRLELVSKNKQANQTVIKLREMGRNDLADAVESGALKGTDAWTLAFKPPSAFQEKLDFIKGKTPEEIKFYKESGILGGGTTVNLGDNKAYYDAVGKDIASMKSTWRGRGELARSSLTTYQALSAALQNFGPTGPGAETMQSLRELGARVGMPIDESKLGDGQYLQALKNRMVAEELRRNKGPQTDFDAKFAGTYIPGLGNTTEANRQILNYSKSISLQQTILADMAGSIRMTDPEEASLAIQRIDHLALMSPGAMERKDGTWITFSEFFSSDAKVLIEGVEQKLSSMSALERMTLWSDNYKKRMGFR